MERDTNDPLLARKAREGLEREKRKPPFSPSPCSVEFTGRQVIENKLMTALEDEGTVAILASKDDLELMVAALRKYKHRRAEGMAFDYQQLLDAAFPPNDKVSYHADNEGEAHGKDTNDK